MCTGVSGRLSGANRIFLSCCCGIWIFNKSLLLLYNSKTENKALQIIKHGVKGVFKSFFYWIKLLDRMLYLTLICRIRPSWIPDTMSNLKCTLQHNYGFEAWNIFLHFAFYFYLFAVLIRKGPHLYRWFLWMTVYRREWCLTYCKAGPVLSG